MSSSERKFHVVAIGAATQDVFVQSKQSKIIEIREEGHNASYMAFPYGSKVDVQEVLFMTGGGATNVAVALAKQSFKTACVSCIGTDEAAASIEKRLSRDGVDTSLFIKNPTLGTAYSVILTSFEGDRTVLVYRGASESLSVDQMDFDKILDTDWIFVGNLGKASESIYPTLFAEAHKRNVKIAFNPGVAMLKKGLEANVPILKMVDVFLVNREECLMLHGKPEDIRYDIIEEQNLYKELLTSLARYVRVPVITDGWRGVHALKDDSLYFCPAFKVKAVSTLGAGDAFGATFVAGLYKYNDISRALIEASANAASVIQGFGAKKRLLTRDGIKEFLNSNPPIEVIQTPIAAKPAGIISCSSIDLKAAFEKLDMKNKN